MKIFFQKLKTSQLLTILQNYDFSYFIASVALTQMAINMANVVVIILVYHLTSSSFLVSLLILSFMIPQIFLSFIGGMVADSRDKKRILLYGNILRGVLFVLLFFNIESLPIVYAISFTISVITQFYIPAETPLIPSLVSRDLLTAANSLFSIALFGSILIGYIVAGPLIEELGRAEIFLFIGGVFFIAALFIYKIPSIYFSTKKLSGFKVSPSKYSIISELNNTYKMILQTKKVIGPFLLLTFSQVTVLILATILPGYAEKILEIKAENLTPILFGPAALGMVIASVLLGGIWNNVKREKLLTSGLIGSGLVFLLFPFTTKIVTRQIVYSLNVYLPKVLDITPVHFAIVLAFFAGFCNALLFIPSQTLLQEIIPENFRSKVYGLLFAMIGILSLGPILLTGGLADKIGVGSVLFILGTIVILIGLVRAILEYLLNTKVALKAKKN